MIIRIVLGFVAFELIAMLIVLIGLKRRNQRKIFWSIAIVMFIGALLAIAIGAVKLVHEDLTPNHLGIAGIFMAIIFAGVNVYIAEKLHKLEPKFKEREEALQAKATASEHEVPIVEASAQDEIIQNSEMRAFGNLLRTKLNGKLHLSKMNWLNLRVNALICGQNTTKR
jgi:disulfide bond formation protein DsbB